MSPRGRKFLTGDVLENLMRRSAMSLKATNPRARMAVVKAAMDVLGSVIDEQDTIFFVTFTPSQFAMPLSQARSFDFQRLGVWACEQLHGCDHFGAIEGAYYSNYPRHPFKHNQEPWVSFHTHHLCWNVDAGKIDAITKRVNATYLAFVSGLDPAHYARYRAPGAKARIFYLLKGPLEEYRIVNMTQDDQVPEQKKRPFRPIDAVRMFKTMGNRTMRDVLVAGGNGFDIAKHVISRAQRATRREDRELENRLSTLITLPARRH
ncbi:MAG: hypothetical protein ACTHKQ_18090 [Mesorhizobium sp.]